MPGAPSNAFLAWCLINKKSIDNFDFSFSITNDRNIRYGITQSPKILLFFRSVVGKLREKLGL
jgi:hypothetical protein